MKERVRTTELTVVLERRPHRDEVNGKVTFSGFDIRWPDGRRTGVGLQRFCHQGTRLLLGRGVDVDRAVVRVSLYPVADLEAPLTRPGPGIRCRRFYTIRNRDRVRLYFFTGAETEVVFDCRRDEAAVLRWLQVERMKPGQPFWFDLASQMIEVGQPAAAEEVPAGRRGRRGERPLAQVR